MSKTIHAFDFLEASDDLAVPPVCVAFGDEPFLKRLVLHRLRQIVLGEDDVPFATFEGKTFEWRDVVDELSTVSLFGEGARLVILESADEFVSQNRKTLEEYVAKPKPSGVLILDVDSWPSNTNLYKAVAKTGLLIDCRVPQINTGGRSTAADSKRICKWLAARCEDVHGVKLLSAAAQLLLELVGPEFGVLDQDMAKLAIYAGADKKITADLVRDVVGGWRTKTMWELADAAADGDAAEALKQLGRLLQSGEHPAALFGQLSWSLRRFTTATRVVQRAERQGRRIALNEALLQAGFRKWPPEALKRSESQLKQLGRQRAGQLCRWLLETDLALKGSHSTPDRARFVLEQLIVRLAQQFRPRRKVR